MVHERVGGRLPVVLCLGIAAVVACLAGDAHADFKDGMRALKAEDYETARKEFSAEAKKGNADAQANMAALYYSGLGVKTDPAEALQWFRKAAEQGYPDAQYYLFAMHNNGDGVEKNFAAGLEWLIRSAKQGNAQALSTVEELKKRGIRVDY